MFDSVIQNPTNCYSHVDKLKIHCEWLCIANCIRLPQRALPRISYNQDLVVIVTTEEGVTPACIKEHAITTMILQI